MRKSPISALIHFREASNKMKMDSHGPELAQARSHDVSFLVALAALLGTARNASSSLKRFFTAEKGPPDKPTHTHPTIGQWGNKAVTSAVLSVAKWMGQKPDLDL